MTNSNMDSLERKPVSLNINMSKATIPGDTFPTFTEKQMDMIVKAKTEAFVQGARDVGEVRSDERRVRERV